ncbi:MAG: winged helix-turn-helix domain-containing protein [Bdellovibrionales bacterium]|nr:winged helix-turn-helix domain-containing protein [Bdellovibrionales bacterium]
MISRGQLFLEKCELVLAKNTFLEVIEVARKAGDREALTEAIAVMLRLAAEAKDTDAIPRWDAELEVLLPGASGRTLALAWHNRAVVATHVGEHRRAQTYLYRAIAALGGSRNPERLAPADQRLFVKIWASMAATFMDRKLNRRMETTADELIRKYEDRGYYSEMTTLYIVKGMGAERSRQYEKAREWYQKAHAAVLADRNWYFHLYVLYAYARIERHTRNFAQAYWYLDLIERAAAGPEFGNLRAIVKSEREKLSLDAVDLLIDSRLCEVRTREKQDLSLGKQYVLLGILEALTEAHTRDAPDSERGLAKAEIIERVWREKYRPESHDNKLYYNINRLRKLIEPDMKHPKYLLNWKEGYRLAPGLKVHFIGRSAFNQGSQKRGSE